MLKHVQTSPHRHLSISSLKKPLVDDGSPKHIRQTSSPTVLFVPRPSSSSSSSESSWPHSSFSSSCCKSDSSSQHKESDDDSFEPLPQVPYDRLGKRNSIGGTKVSQNHPICPNCLKKKKSSVVPVSLQLRRKSDFAAHPSNFSCTNLNDSLKCVSVKNGNACSCSRDYLKKFQKCVTIQYQNDNGTNIHISQSRVSTPTSQDRMVLLEEEEEEGSSCISSSPSQSSSSSSISSKSPLTYPRGKPPHRRVLEDKGPFCRQDNLSLDSSMSCSTTSQEDGSLSSSAMSLQDSNKQTMVRIWVRCLLQEMEYKTLSVSYNTTCRQVVSQLLSKFRMKHRDPNLFYLAMEVTIRKAGAEVRQCLRLDDSAFPAQLVECHPKEDSRLALRMRRGGLLRIYDQALSQGSHYKSLLVGEKTSCAEVVALVLACNKVAENVYHYTLFEVWPQEHRERVLRHAEEPMVIAGQWPDKETARFEIRKLPAGMQVRNHDCSPHLDRETTKTAAKWREKLNSSNCSEEPLQDDDSSTSGIASSISSSSSPLPPPDELTKPKRKLPLPPKPDLETCVDSSAEDGLDPNHPAHGFKTYNDYENYFYI